MPVSIDVPPPPPAPPIEWPRAWRAMRHLIANPDDTEQAFEVISAFAGGESERLFQRFVASPEGQAPWRERPSLMAVLADREALRAMPPGSFGRAYAEFMGASGLDAQGLVEAERRSDAAAERVERLDPGRRWFGERVRDMHDLWHVPAGYGRDEAGEAANLAFSYAHLPYRGIALLLFGIVLYGPPPHVGRIAWLRYLYRAWARGRAAAWLPAVPYERLLERPLEEVRRTLRIAPPEAAHPAGIIVATMDGPQPVPAG